MGSFSTKRGGAGDRFGDYFFRHNYKIQETKSTYRNISKLRLYMLCVKLSIRGRILGHDGESVL